MNIIQKLADKSNYGGSRPTSQIKYIVIHYTANDGDKAWNNANYFQTPNRKASAHYFVDDNNIYQSVADNYIAWSVGGSKYTDCDDTGGGKLYGKCTNTNSISIELCDTNRNGVIYPTDATIKLAITLTKELMVKYNIAYDNVIRHFDVNGKHCPAYWMDNTKWESEFHSKLVKNPLDVALHFDKTVAGTYVATSNVNLRVGAGLGKKKITQIKKGESVKNYGYYNLTGKTKWLLVSYKDKTGYACIKRLKKKG